MYHSVSCAAADIRSGDRLSSLLGESDGIETSAAALTVEAGLKSRQPIIAFGDEETGFATLLVRQDSSMVPTIVSQRRLHWRYPVHNCRLPTSDIDDGSHEPKALVS
jgi:hypothetical protein